MKIELPSLPPAMDPAQLKRTLEHVGSRGALDIEGLGEQTSIELVERDFVHDIGDRPNFFAVPVDHWMPAELGYLIVVVHLSS